MFSSIYSSDGGGSGTSSSSHRSIRDLLSQAKVTEGKEVTSTNMAD